jgi:hypothetical protein
MQSGAEQNADLLVQSVSRNLPPHDATATDVQECYPLKRLIPLHVWKDLDIKEFMTASKNTAMVDKWRRQKL